MSAGTPSKFDPVFAQNWSKRLSPRKKVQCSAGELGVLDGACIPMDAIAPSRGDARGQRVVCVHSPCTFSTAAHDVFTSPVITMLKATAAEIRPTFFQFWSTFVITLPILANSGQFWEQSRPMFGRCWRPTRGTHPKQLMGVFLESFLSIFWAFVRRTRRNLGAQVIASLYIVRGLLEADQRVQSYANVESSPQAPQRAPRWSISIGRLVPISGRSGPILADVGRN